MGTLAQIAVVSGLCSHVCVCVSVLARAQETGREALIIHAAQTEGSHYVCEMCGGVVACARKAQHDTYWCQPEGEAGDEAGDTALAQQPDSVGTYQAKDNSSNAEAAMAMSP